MILVEVLELLAQAVTLLPLGIVHLAGGLLLRLPARRAG